MTKSRQPSIEGGRVGNVELPQYYYGHRNTGLLSNQTQRQGTESAYRLYLAIGARQKILVITSTVRAPGAPVAQ